MNLSDFKFDGNTAETVENIKKSGRLPHALLLEGESEAAMSLAVFLSAYAVCTGENKPCGVCKGCLNALNKTHADISYISPEASRKSKTVSIDQIRELAKDAYIKPNDGAAKVYIFENADKTLSEVVQNAFLKLLEEPPRGVYFILLCQSSRALLSTIISRCSVINLGGNTEPDSEAVQAAEAIAEGILSPREYELLKALRALESKELCDDILMCVKLLLFDAAAILSGAKAKQNPMLSKKLAARFTRQKLLDMIELTDSAKYKIKQNININLLTTQLCGEYRRISWQR